MKNIKNILLFGLGIPILSSIIAVAILLALNSGILMFVGLILSSGILYWINRKKITPVIFYMNIIYLLVLIITFTAFMFISKGAIEGSFMQRIQPVLFPYFIFVPFGLLAAGTLLDILVSIVITLLIQIGICYSCKEVQSSRLSKGMTILTCLVLIISCIPNYKLYNNRPAKIYSGHGFEYMNGYSSTDFTDYTVYAKNSKLALLDHIPDLIIENEEDMPVFDGAEACYPFYASVAKAIYKDIDQIELSNQNSNYNGKIVTFTNTINAFERLLDEEVDIVIGARLSKDQLNEANNRGVEVEVTPIGKEAFVFFVEEDNPIDNISSEDIKKIYSGNITNWKELGGKDQEIVAFQRPIGSGSQTMMEYFMGDTPLKEPLKYEMVDSMVGVIQQVAEYHNEAGSMGYSFRYFIEGLQQEKNVKIISIDGIKPTIDNIQNGSYLLTTSLCMITRKENDNEYIEKVKEFILSEDGQYLVEHTGYSPLVK